MSGNDMPPDPLQSDVQQGFVQLHEMFLTLTVAGFTEPQALTIVSNILMGRQS